MTIIFDLDGTLTYTLVDLMNSTNYALRMEGYAERSMEEIRRFVGNGVHKLIERAVPEGTSTEDIEDTFNIFKAHYVVHCQDNTRLYDGVDEMLRQLKTEGHQMAIVSNKLQAGVDSLYDQYFRDTIKVAVGQRQGIALKPQPDMVYLAMEEMGLTSNDKGRCDNAVYIGDSEVDLLTARNSGLPCISVLWGFRDKPFLVAQGAELLAETPADVIDIIHNM